MAAYNNPIDEVPIFNNTLFPTKTAQASDFVEIVSNQTIDGVKTFTSPPVSTIAPTENTQIANKQYVDSVGATLVDKTTAETIAGIKTFSSVPVCSTQPSSNSQLANKEYVDSVSNTLVDKTSAETIAGIKTFSSVPVCSTQPSSNSQLANKEYVDTGNSNQVTTNTTQTISGVKTFSGDLKFDTMKFLNTGSNSGTNGPTFNSFCPPIWTMTGQYLSSNTLGANVTYSDTQIIGSTSNGVGWNCQTTGSLYPSHTDGGVSVSAENANQFSPSTGKWTCRVKGTYMINFCAFQQGTISARVGLVREGGTASYYYIRTADSSPTVQGSISLNLNRDDTIYFKNATGGVNLTLYFESAGYFHTWATITRYVG